MKKVGGLGNPEKKKITVEQVLAIQVFANFIVVGILLTAAGFLVFYIMGKDYTRFTVAGFLATTYLAFITFLPAGTLFAARKEFIEGKVALASGNNCRVFDKVLSPWRQTLPAGATIAFICTTLIAALIYWTGWKPSPVVTVILAWLYVIPHYFITRRCIADDLAAMNAVGLGSERPVSSKSRYFWTAYIFPNLVFQAIINVAIANRGFSQEMLKLTGQGSEYAGMIPVSAVGIDLTVSSIFVFNFTFLGTIMYVISDMYLGKFTYRGNARGIHGFLYFIIMILIWLTFGVVYTVGMQAIGVGHISFVHAMMFKLILLLIAVYLGSSLATGWTGKRFNQATAELFS